MKPRISVISVSCNQSRFLERSLCSVIDQAYANLEHIVVDRGSTDDSVHVIGLYADQVDHWINLPHDSHVDAINAGLARATGDIIAVLDGADVYPVGTLDSVAAHWSRLGSPGWVVGHCQRIGAFDEALGMDYAFRPRCLDSFLRHDSGVIPVSSTFISGDCMRHHGPFDAALQHAYHYEYCCRLIADGMFPLILDDVFASRRDVHAPCCATDTVRRGLEHLDAAWRFADTLPQPRRDALWSNIDRRRRIFTLAQAEVVGKGARQFMLHELMRHPWWLNDHQIRHTLLHGVAHPLPPEMAA